MDSLIDIVEQWIGVRIGMIGYTVAIFVELKDHQIIAPIVINWSSVGMIQPHYLYIFDGIWLQTDNLLPERTEIILEDNHINIHDVDRIILAMRPHHG